MNDLWNSAAFNFVEMTNAINLLPRTGDDISTILPFKEVPVYTHDFALDITRRDQVSLVPVSDLGGEGDILPDDETADARRFTIPNYVRRAFIRNFEVMGARIPGTNQQRILEVERDKKLTRLRTNFDETKSIQRWSALFGKVTALDVKGNVRVLLDTCRELGLQRSKLKIRLKDGEKTINAQLVDAKVRIEKQLGFKPSRYVWLLCETPHQKLREHQEFRTLETAQQAVRFAITDGRNRNVVFADNVEVVYFSSPRVDETKSLLIPIFDDWARTVNGPSISSDFDQVLPMYVQKKILDWNEGLEVKGSMRTITFTTRPDTIYEVELGD